MADNTYDKKFLYIICGLSMLLLIVNVSRTFMKEESYENVIDMAEPFEEEPFEEEPFEEEPFEESVENYKRQEDYSSNTMWSNGGVYNGIGTDGRNFDTKLACSCSGYGVKRHHRDDMPINDDSNLYNSPLLHAQFPLSNK